MKAGTETDPIFTSGVSSPLDDKWRSIAVNFFPSPRRMKIDWTMDRTWEKSILHTKKVMTLVMVPSKKTKNMPITLAVLLVEKSAKIVLVFPNYAKTYASTIDKRLGRPQNGLSPVPDVIGKVSRGSHKSTHRIYSLDDATLLARGELESNAHLLTLPRSPRMERHSAGCSSHEQTF